MLGLSSILFLIIPPLIGVAFFTLLERKFLSLSGIRIGPNKVSLSGFLQPIGDAVKLSNKQINLLSNFSSFFYYMSSSLMFISSILVWFCVFLDPPVFSFKYGVLLLMLILSLNSLNSIVSGWSTFSKYSLMGSLRTVSQLISYEAVLYFCIFFFAVIFCSFNFNSFIWFPIFFFGFLVPSCFYIWFPSFLAELNRTPYDFSEGESELVSGFNTEFGSLSFTFIFLAEYGNILFFCLISSFLFFMGMFYSIFFLFSLYVIWIRSVLPRFRFDKLLMLAWKFLIPFITIIFCFSYMFFY